MKHYKICPQCGSAIPIFKNHRFDWKDENTLRFRGSAIAQNTPIDEGNWYIWRAEDYPNLDKAKIGKWTDRKKLFKEAP